MKATDVIIRDHRAAEALFEEYKQATQEEREELEEKIFDALETHEHMEDAYFYPELEEALAENAAFIELEEEQEALADELAAIKDMDEDEDRSASLLGLMDKVLAHAEREEAEILPEAERILSAETLDELGEKMEPESAVANEQ